MACARAAPAPEDAATTAQAVRHAVEVMQSRAARHRLLLLGEFHGTREIPQLAAALVQAYSADAPVLLALEIDQAEQPAIAAYLRSDGSRRAREGLRTRAFWRRTDTQHDGRRNEDVIDLIDAVRRMRHDGRDVAVLAFDVPLAADHHARDRAMATVLRAAHRALPRGRIVVVTGNVHAMVERPRWAPPVMQTPMGAHLRDLRPVSFRITARSGEFWGCRATCGPIAADGARTRTGPSHGGYHHVVVLPRLRIARLMGASTVH